MARPIEKRQHIERAVVEVVARKGLPATTIQDIAVAATVSQGLLYRYWENRDDLAGDVYRKQLATLLGRLAVRAAGRPTLWDQIDALVDGFLEFADEQPVVLTFILLSQHHLHGSVPESQGIFAFLRPILEEGMRNGVLRPLDVGISLQFALGIVMQPVIGATYGNLPRPIAQYRKVICEALRRVLGADSEARKR